MKRTILALLFSLSMLLISCGPPRHDSQLLNDPAALQESIRTDLLSLRGSVDTYFHRYADLPWHLPDLRDTPDQQTLLEAIPTDPWRVPYLLRRIGDDIILSSTGPDLLVGTDDDVELRVSYVGVTPKGQ
ncbi:MAG: hypothetical protein RBU37_20560 [Myxococcota bacterium]|jgi:hypothetical protein|nr:hypothetical protein [Myxococcota bacterium]